MWIGFVFSHPLNTAWFSLSPHPCCRAGTAPFPHSSGWAPSSAQAHFWELGAYRTLLTFILIFISSHLSPLCRETLSEISSPKLISWAWSVFFFQRKVRCCQQHNLSPSCFVATTKCPMCSLLSHPPRVSEFSFWDLLLSPGIVCDRLMHIHPEWGLCFLGLSDLNSFLLAMIKAPSTPAPCQAFISVEAGWEELSAATCLAPSPRSSFKQHCQIWDNWEKCWLTCWSRYSSEMVKSVK